MRKIRIIEHISLGGVIQALGVPGEDGDCPYGGWTVRMPARPCFCWAAGPTISGAAIGRNAGKSPLADSLNAAAK
ncbi:MAG: hypothetical protein ABSE86_31275 [Bryobacteraceae bacterium]|jgi:hypothetical protein